MDLHLYSAFLVFQPLKAFYTTYIHTFTYSRTHIHILMIEHSGAIWGSVSCPKTLWLRTWGSNRRSSYQWTTCSTSWTTTASSLFKHTYPCFEGISRILKDPSNYLDEIIFCLLPSKKVSQVATVFPHPIIDGGLKWHISILSFYDVNQN